MRYVNLDDLERLASEKLPGPIFDFIAGGAEDEVTLRANRAAFEAVHLRPRVLVDVSHVDTSTTVLGHRLPVPVMLAPVAFHKLADPDGEMAVARAAARTGAVMVLSTMSSYDIEEVAAAADGEKWFQLYVYKDRGVTARLVERAQAAGYSALCVTVDNPKLGRRERDLRNALTFPDDVMPKNFAQEMDLSSMPTGAQSSAIAALAASLLDPALTWETIGWLESITTMPLVLKGIMTGEDARTAVERGVKAIVVSNHGGRQLDGAAASIEVLPEVVEAVDGRVPVLVDGGIRRGTDVLKALALGAQAVLIGRPYVFGLAVDGERGVTKCLEMLRAELELAMSLTGVTAIDQITPGVIRRR
jgi:4-hydroxymandelate oxidase